VLAAHREEAVFHLVEDLRLRAGDLRLDGVVLGVLSEVAVDVAVDRSADGVDDVGAVRLVLVFRLLDELRELPVICLNSRRCSRRCGRRMAAFRSSSDGFAVPCSVMSYSVSPVRSVASRRPGRLCVDSGMRSRDAAALDDDSGPRADRKADRVADLFTHPREAFHVDLPADVVADLDHLQLEEHVGDRPERADRVVVDGRGIDGEHHHLPL